MSPSTTVLCELTGKAPDDREWLCECQTCRHWRSKQPTGILAAARFTLIEAARAYVQAHSIKTGNTLWLDDEDPAAEIVLPTSRAPGDHVGLLVVHSGDRNNVAS
jgi:hypothetical protein